MCRILREGSERTGNLEVPSIVSASDRDRLRTLRYCCSPGSEPRPRFLARSLRGSRSPASVGPIPARALSGSRATAERSDPELRSFRRTLRKRRDNEVSFASLLRRRGNIVVLLLLEIRALLLRLLLLLLMRLRSRLVAELRYLFDLSVWRSLSFCLAFPVPSG